VSAFVWLTWRQHRWTVIGTASLALAAAFALVSAELAMKDIDSMPLTGFYGLMVQLVFGGVIGAFWGAPLLAREFEERTYFVAWGQDVTPVRWVRGKVLVLAGPALVLGALVGISDGHVGGGTAWSGFEADPVVQAGYAIFGLALGVFIGLITRNVVAAMAVTVVLYTVCRVLLAVQARDHYLPASRAIAHWGSTNVIPAGAIELGSGYVDADLRAVSPADDLCGTFAELDNCMRTTGTAVGKYVDYLPVERITAFRFAEFVVCALLAAVLFALTFRFLRHDGGGGWKPSRRHRRLDPEAAAVTGSTPKPAAAQG
jgi:hypothetical protein